jgi:hypothetical protein
MPGEPYTFAMQSVSSEAHSGASMKVMLLVVAALIVWFVVQLA